MTFTTESTASATDKISGYDYDKTRVSHFTLRPQDAVTLGGIDLVMTQVFLAVDERLRPMRHDANLAVLPGPLRVAESRISAVENNDPAHRNHVSLASNRRVKFAIAKTRARSVWISRLESFGNLQPGWNRYSAPPPSSKAIDHARRYLELLNLVNHEPTRLAPSAVGGIGITHSIGDKFAYLEFYNDGSAHCLLSDDSDDSEDTFSADVTSAGLRQCIERIRLFFNE